MASDICKGSRVETSGQGRTARWGHYAGRVTMVRGKRIYVVWDSTHFEDEMDSTEVQLEVTA